MPGRRQLDEDRQRRGHPRGQTHTDEKAQDRKDLPGAAGNEADQAGADRADERADDHLGLAPPGIGEPAEYERAEDRANATAIKDQRGLTVGEVPFRRERRKEIADDKEIEKFEHEQQRQKRKRRPIATVERRTVE